MSHLGDFGTEHAPVESTFGYFGASLRANPDLSDVMVVEMFGNLAESPDQVRKLASTLVHSDDVDEFWRLVRDNRQTMEDLATLAMALIEALTERPTRLPSDSSAGQSRTAPKSEVDSSSRALKVLDGRPDLQVAIVQADEARRAG